jgi:hypothetical protein
MIFIDKVLNRTAGKLRFPKLLLIMGALFIVDLLVPDIIPFIDEILLGLSTLAVARLREPKQKSDINPSA